MMTFSSNYITFGRYKINTKISKELDSELYSYVKKHTSIANLGDGEIVFYIEPYDVPRIIDFEIDKLTNFKEYLNLTSQQMAQLQDTHLQEGLQFLEKLMIGYLNQVQTAVIKKLYTLNNIQKEN